MADEDTPSVQEVKDEPFKKPVLIGRIGKLPKRANIVAKKAPEENTPQMPIEPKETAPETSSNSFVIPQVSSKELSAPVPYKEPKWSGLCPDGKLVKMLRSLHPYIVFIPLGPVITEHNTLSPNPLFLNQTLSALNGIFNGNFEIGTLSSLKS